MIDFSTTNITKGKNEQFNEGNSCGVDGET